ncbi:potassium transporter TrkA [Streptosporangium sp. NPDC049376]|uniref:CASTOR/POLLUX-related putative ion channel n=1 Tax=Streptosporangium sp. NPDC049376 TaxID=3366192 RepID=UPI0037B49215
MRRLRYRFDNLVIRGGWAVLGLLVLVALAVSVAGATALVVLVPDATDLPLALWSGLTRTLSPVTATPEEGPPPLPRGTPVVALTGIVIFSALVGLVKTGLDRRLAGLRKGRSPVVERGHTVVLGWSEQVFLILSELAAAGEGRGGTTCVAILADMDRTAMEEAIGGRAALRNLRVVCRTGNPTDPADVAIVSPERARAVIVLGSEDTDSDARTIKSLLALDAAEVRPRVQLVAGVRDPDNLVAARLAGGSGALIVDVDEISARVVVQSCLNPGLSVVYGDLLGSGGSEICFRQPCDLVGENFGDALPALENGSLIGLERRGRIMLNPSGETRIDANDRLVLIMGDGGAKQFRTSAEPDSHEIIASGEHTPTAHRVLILGWNGRGAAIVTEFDRRMPPGSQVRVVAHDSRMASRMDALAGSLANVTLAHESGDITRYGTLEALGVGTYDHVLILADDRLGAHVADSRTLLTLLHVREMTRSNGWRHSLVTEMARECDRRLAEVTEVDDLIVPTRVTGLLMIQIAEHPRRHDVFTDLFAAGGQEVSLRPAGDYVRLSVPVDYATVVAAARAYGEIAIGYRGDRTARGDGGVVLNPPKSRKVVFEADDAVIVLSGRASARKDDLRTDVEHLETLNHEIT